MHAPVRQRLLDGFVRRLAVARDADAYALRGGMLIQTWIPGRVVRDIDLVCRLPYQPRDLHARLGELLARELADGVVFDEVYRVDALPRVRALQLFARGEVEGVAAELSVDLAFGIDVWPRAARHPVAGALPWSCPQELIVATKLKLLDELGPTGWRTKDLADLWQLLRRDPPLAILGEACERTGAATAILERPWWREGRAAERWARRAAADPTVPWELAGVLAELRARLTRRSRAA